MDNISGDNAPLPLPAAVSSVPCHDLPRSHLPAVSLLFRRFRVLGRSPGGGNRDLLYLPMRALLCVNGMKSNMAHHLASHKRRAQYISRHSSLRGIARI